PCQFAKPVPLHRLARDDCLRKPAAAQQPVRVVVVVWPSLSVTMNLLVRVEMKSSAPTKPSLSQAAVMVKEVKLYKRVLWLASWMITRPLRVGTTMSAPAFPSVSISELIWNVPENE